MTRGPRWQQPAVPGSARPPRPAAPGAGARTSGAGPIAGSILGLQRRAGNTAVVETLRSGRLIGVAQAATKLRAAQQARPTSQSAPGVRYRVPTNADLKALQSSGTLDEADLEAAVRRALERMDLDFALRTDSGDVMNKIFHGGAFDEAAAATVLGTSRDDVYQSVADEEAKLTPEDTVRLKAIGPAALREMEAAANDASGLADVFGTKAKLAAARYRKGKAALAKALNHIDTAFDADYNLDANQVSLGGWAIFSQGHIHLLADIAHVTDRDESIITIIHESMHLADPAVGDHGYYGEPGFESKPDGTKVDNAAHYEELPRRSFGMSRYAEHPEDPLSPLQTFKKFKPGVTAAGTGQTFEDHVREDVDTYLNQAWDAVLDVLDFVRSVARDMAAHPTGGSFAAHKTHLLEISQKEGLTIHKQKPHPATVSTLDVALSEGVARAVATIWGAARKQPAPTGSDRAAAVSAMIDGSIATYGALLDTPAENRQLTDWLVAHYKFSW
jgi:hypothetical protein